MASLTRPDASIQARYQYDAWGNERAQAGASFNRFGYTGHEKDAETGLYYFKARFYDPETGRFLSQDSYLGDVNTAPSLHRYLYAYANPTVWVDLDGYEACVGHELANCSMQQYVPPKAAVPQIVSNEALAGSTELYEVAQDRVGGDGTKVQPAEAHVFTNNYRLVPHVREDASKPGVVYYDAYNSKTQQFDYIVPPGDLDRFIANEEAHATYAANAQALGLDNASIEMARTTRAIGGTESVGQALGHAGKAWVETVSEPTNWLGAIPGGGVGVGLMKPALRQGARQVIRQEIRNETRSIANGGRTLVVPKEKTEVFGEWQRAATEGRLIRTDPKTVRGSGFRKRLADEQGPPPRSDYDADHKIELCVGGADCAKTNGQWLGRSPNRASGPKVYNQVKDDPIGTVYTDVTLEK